MSSSMSLLSWGLNSGDFVVFPVFFVFFRHFLNFPKPVPKEACGLGDDSGNSTTQPNMVKQLIGRDLRKMGGSLFKHTLAMGGSGGVWSWGSGNEYSQLGREGSGGVPRMIGSLEAVVVVDVACGEDYSVVATSTGAVFAWGKNHVGQCGTGDRVAVPKPKLIKGPLANKTVVQVAAGRSHTLFLCRTGELYGCGDGWIGNGDVTGKLEPAPIAHIYGAPIVKIACGESHSMALTSGGVVWTWGSNSFGALGFKGPDSYRPIPLDSMGQVVDICAGAYHALALTIEGRVLSWGKNSDGQLGYPTVGSPVSFAPRILSDLLGTHVVALAAGRRNSFFVSDDGRVYACGPASVCAGVDASKGVTLVDSLRGATQVWAGSLSAFAFFGGGGGGGGSSTMTAPQGVFSFDESVVPEEGSLFSSSSRCSEAVRVVESSFSSAAAINGSFLHPVKRFSTNVEDNPGIEFGRAISVLQRLWRVGGKPVQEAMANAFSRAIRNTLDSCSSKSPECLRVWLLCFANPAMAEPQLYGVVIDRLLVSLIGLGKRARYTLEHWWANLPLNEYMHIVKVIQHYVDWVMTTLDGRALKGRVVNGAVALERLHNARSSSDVPSDAFYIEGLSSYIDLVHEYTQFVQSAATFSWLRYPYLLTPQAKANLVAIAFKSEMERAFVQQRMGPGGFTILSVRRSHLVEDAFSQLHALSTTSQLLRPLKVIFSGEMGVDEGGLTKELFVLILESLLNPDLGMFTFNRESGTNWFNRATVDHVPMVHFELLGMVVGLSVANGVILNLDFPELLYSKLLNKISVYKLSHLAQVDPELERQLHNLLTYEGDFADLGLTFSVTTSLLGESKTVPLVPGGEEMPVTESNVRHYIDTYVKYLLCDSIAKPFAAFQAGFKRVVCNNVVVPLLNETELRLLVEGSTEREIHLEDMRSSAQYLPPLHAQHPLIMMLWSVLSKFSQSEARSFLKFCFGGPGVPIQGLKGFRFAVQAMGVDPTALPVAHTCANLLDLPPYPDEQTMRAKLLLAMQEGVGFQVI